MRGLLHRNHASFYEVQSNSRERIMSGMGHHPRPQALSPERQQSEHSAENRNQTHPAGAFISMSRAKKNCLDDQAEINTPGKRGKLLLKIPAEDDLFHETRHRAEQNKGGEGQRACWSEHVCQFLCFPGL